jgi:hypothetical protein
MKKHGFHGPVRALMLAAGLFAAQASLAQVSSGALSGRVAATDKVVVRNVDTGLVREVKVKDDGTFWVRRLPVGTYEVTVTHADGSEQKILAAAKIGITTRVL